MEAKYHEQALETSSLMVPGCGSDSLLAELGFIFNSRQWMAPAVRNRMEAYVSLESDKSIVANFATCESAVLGMTNVHKLQELQLSSPKRARPMLVQKGHS